MIASGRNIFARMSAVDAVGLSVFVGLVLLFVFGLWAPSAVREQQEAARQQAAARQRQRVDGTLAVTRSLAEEIKKTKAAIQASPLNLRPETALNERLADLMALSADCKFTVDDLKPATAVRGARFASIAITLSGHGGYRDTVRFLHELHDRFSDIGLAALKLTGNPEQPGANCTGVFELQWLAQPEVGAPTPSQIVAVPLQ